MIDLKYIPVAVSLTLLTGYLLAAEGPPPARVITEPVREQQVAESHRFAGILHFARVADVSSEVAGVVTRAPLEAGQSIEKGALLAVTDTAFAQQDIAITRGQMAEVEAQLNKQRTVLKRREALMATNATSQNAFDDAFYTVQALERQLETLKERVKRKQLEIDKSEVHAPFDGLVLDTYVEEGEAVSPQSAIAAVAALSSVEAHVSITQSLMKFQTLGTDVRVDIDALSERKVGVIKGYKPTVDLRSKNITLKISLPYAPGMLQNMAVNVELPVGGQKSLRVINRDAVVSFQGSDFVFAAIDGLATMMPVSIVARLGDVIAVDNADIVAGMSIVVDGNDRLQPNQAIEVIEVQ
ncbi:MAG: efflux RND transporter periplasmic adaptor subunit [Pseudomonadota bacterium]